MQRSSGASAAEVNGGTAEAYIHVGRTPLVASIGGDRTHGTDLELVLDAEAYSHDPDDQTLPLEGYEWSCTDPLVVQEGGSVCLGSDASCESVLSLHAPPPAPRVCSEPSPPPPG